MLQFFKIFSTAIASIFFCLFSITISKIFVFLLIRSANTSFISIFQQWKIHFIHTALFLLPLLTIYMSWHVETFASDYLFLVQLRETLGVDSQDWNFGDMVDQNRNVYKEHSIQVTSSREIRSILIVWRWDWTYVSVANACKMHLKVEFFHCGYKYLLIKSDRWVHKLLSRSNVQSCFYNSVYVSGIQ